MEQQITLNTLQRVFRVFIMRISTPIGQITMMNWKTMIMVCIPLLQGCSLTTSRSHVLQYLIVTVPNLNALRVSLLFFACFGVF